jgi:hypothetical protein
MKIIIAITILMSLLAIIVALSFIFSWPQTHRNISTNTWSYEFQNKDEKLSFLAEYMMAYSEIEDAEYHIIYHDNSGGLVPGPSDWDIRVALKVKSHDMSLWIEGFDEISSSEVDLAWWGGLETENISWNHEDAICYKRPGAYVYLVAFPEQGIILKAIGTLAYPLPMI